MNPVVHPLDMRRIDEMVVEEGYYTSLELMQNAAEALYEEVAAELDRCGISKVLLLAGFGNNGGDAYALALLLQKYYQPAILPVGEGKRSPDCEYYYQKCREVGIPFVESHEGYPLVIDGVFGNGFKGNLPGAVQVLFSKIRVPVIAIDVPSGMEAKSGRCSPYTLKPEMTVTFAMLKPCHLLADCGKVVLKDIGIPKKFYEDARYTTLEPVVRPRDPRGHKNTFGSVGLLVGAAQYPGAAALALTGALKSGAGLVFGYLPSLARQAAAAKFYGPVLLPPRKLFPLRCNAYLAGSGLGRGLLAGIKMFFLWHSNCPLVVDGDGLWHMKKFARPYHFRNAPTILTPHIGEFARMTGKTVEEIKADPLLIVGGYAIAYNAVVVLKDSATIVATPENPGVILSEPCSGLAKGGSGDLLAGLIAGLLAGGMDPFDAAKTGVYLHNKAGQLAAKEHSVRSLQPEEIAEKIDAAWQWAESHF